MKDKNENERKHTLKMYYFSYASNMDIDQMERRIPGSDLIEVGILKDYKLVFNRKGTYRAGGVASVVAEPGSEVYGVIWSFDSSLLLKLDEIEDQDAYQRSEQNIIGKSGKEYECFVYTSFPQGNINADPEYLELVISAATKHNFPSAYIHFLEEFRMHES